MVLVGGGSSDGYDDGVWCQAGEGVGGDEVVDVLMLF